MKEPFIKIENLCYSYEDESSFIPAVSSLNLEIGEGEYVAVIGRNGSGKSTFAKLLNMILEPTAGRITVAGRVITSADMSDSEMFEVRRNIGMVFQNPDNQLVATIVEDDVAFGPENIGLPSEEIRRRVDEALETVGMAAFAKHEPHRLSGDRNKELPLPESLQMLPRCIYWMNRPPCLIRQADMRSYQWMEEAEPRDGN